MFAVGANNHDVPIAAAGGLLAMIVVAAAGLKWSGIPLANVPENTLKYAVGVILASIGTFWAAEGMGATWPLDLVSVLALAGIFYAASRLPSALISRPRAAVAVASS